MGLFRDLSGNGSGVVVEPQNALVNVASADATIAGKMSRLRATGAGNITMRPAGATADIVIPILAGETIPISPGTIIRTTGTTATGLTSSSF